VTSTASFPALGTTAVVAVSREEDLARARDLLAAELAAIDLACSRFRDDSELTRANRRSGSPVAVGTLFLEALLVAVDAARSTDGLVDPTLGGDLRRAGYDRTFALVRARERWTIEPRPGRRPRWQQIEIDETRRELRAPPGTELDLGATAKALAADRAANRVAEATGSGALVSLGGDIAVAGEPPPGGWSVRIADDHCAALDGPGPCVSIVSGGLATSSTSVRRWVTDRGEAHHVLDPRSGLPARTPWRTVSVTAVSCVAANVAATAGLILGTRAPRWLAARGLHGRHVAAAGAVVHTGDWPVEVEDAA
jgi:thiamine biosynthesis lipoprotein